MLGKLIRYDSKVQIKFLCGIYAVAGLISVFSGAFRALKNQFPKVAAFGLMSEMAWMFCCLAAVVTVVGSMIYVIAYFRKNLLRDEGYLMHTLPVSSLQLYISKLITGTLLIWLSIGVAILCLGIGSLRFHYPIISIIEESGLSGTENFVLLIVTLMMVFPLTLCQFYASLIIGYTWKIQSSNPINKDLLSVIAFIVIYMIQQILAVISLVVYVVVRYGNPFSPYFSDRFVAMMEGAGSNSVHVQEEILRYIQGMLGLSLVLSLVIGVVLFLVGNYRMNRHLNLE